MFSFLGPFTRLHITDSFHSMPVPFEIFHNTALTPQYRSRGTERSDQFHCIFHYTVRGRGEVIFRNTTYHTAAGQGFLNIINDPLSGYGYPEDGKEPWEFVVISFDGGNTRELVEELLQRQVVYSVDPELFRRLCADLTAPMLSGTGALSCVFRLLDLLAATRKTSPYVTEFCRIVQRDILLNPTIFASAREMKVSREHLQREFRKTMGVTPADYVAKLRLEMLLAFLQEPHSETEIAQRMHFSSVSELSLFFKKQTGITPREYRRRGYLYL